MNTHGVTVWIDEPVDVLVERLIPEKDHRPLIRHLSSEELHTFLSGKLAERIHFYRQATHHLQGDAISDGSFAKIIKQNV
jgi:shikimate kinase